MSKIPPQLRESVSRALQTTAAFTFRHFRLDLLEDFLARTKHFVERFLKVRRAFRQLLANLRNILFEALFYLLPKELFQSAIAQALSVLCWVVSDDVGHESARKPFCALVRILR
jgi:hypothetical protein